MNIGTIGFPQDQQQKLAKILGLSKNNRYVLVEFDHNQLPDLLLLFGADAANDSQLAQLPRGYQSRLIQISKEPPEDSALAHIRFPLVSSRVIRALDQMTHENEELDQDEKDLAEQDADARFSKYEQQAEASDSTVSAAENCGRESYRVLVVDDNQAMQQALGLELEKLPLPVDIDYADSGEHALEQVTQQTYDFIFLDILMPGIDGFDTCTQMREMPALKKTPIIMLTSKTSPLDEVKGIMAGCSTYLTKPIDHDEFQGVISRVSNWVDEFKKDSNNADSSKHSVCS